MSDSPYRNQARYLSWLELAADGWLDSLEEYEAFFREIGTAEEIGERLEALRRVANSVTSALLEAEAEQAAFNAIELLGSRWEQMREKAAQLQGRLESEGWRFDRDKGGLVTLSTPGVKGNNPLRLFSVRVHELFDDSEAGTQSNTREVRERIASALQFDFPKDLLSPAKGAPIDNAIKNRPKAQKRKR